MKNIKMKPCCFNAAWGGWECAIGEALSPICFDQNTGADSIWHLISGAPFTGWIMADMLDKCCIRQCTVS